MDAAVEPILPGNPDYRTGPERAGISIEPKDPRPLRDLYQEQYDADTALEVFESLLLLAASVPLTEDLNKHPLVLVQAAKALVGLRPEAPSQRLMEFALAVCEGPDYEPPDRDLLQVTSDELGEIVSVHELERAILGGDLKAAQKETGRLLTVSDNKAMLFDVLLDIAAHGSRAVETVPFLHSARRAMEFVGTRNVADFLLPALEAAMRKGTVPTVPPMESHSRTPWETLPFLWSADREVVTLAAHTAQIEADEHIRGASIRNGLERSLTVLVGTLEQAEVNEMKSLAGGAADLLAAVRAGEEDKARAMGRFLAEQGERAWLLEVLEGVEEERFTHELVLWADAFRMLLKAATIQHSGLIGEIAGNILIRGIAIS